MNTSLENPSGILEVAKIESWTAGLEARTLPLCHATMTHLDTPSILEQNDFDVVLDEKFFPGRLEGHVFADHHLWDLVQQRGPGAHDARTENK